MLRISLLGFLVSNLLGGAQTLAQSQPILNEPGMAWQVCYDRDDKNRDGDIAVQLRVLHLTGDKFLGTLYRYDRVSADGKHYEQREYGGCVVIQGRVTGYVADSRKRVWIEGEGSYVDKLGVSQDVTIKAFCQPGSRRGRKDDRLVLEVKDSKDAQKTALCEVFKLLQLLASDLQKATDKKDAEYLEKKIGDLVNGLSCADAPGDCKKAVKNLKDLWASLEATEAEKRSQARNRFAIATDDLPPCEETPDDDVLEEDPFADPPAVP